MMKKNLSVLLFLCFSITLLAKPPKPPKGFRWVLNTQYSDEFDGNKLDGSKWQNHYNGGWQGRAPAWFNPDAVWLEDGLLKIKSGVLEKPKGRNGQYTMYGGAVSSTTKNAHFGYYECKAKASKIAMSTTFWMSNDKVPFTENDDCSSDSYSQELDIQEAIGGGTVHAKFRNGMNCNTHYRYVKCGERRETFISKGTGHILHSEVSDDYHIYAAWWKNPNEVLFYANNELFDTVFVRTDVSASPFKRPMQINMVTETYDWQPAPAPEDLENSDINTAFYDWVRSYKLVPVYQVIDDEHNTVLYDNECNTDVIIDDKKLNLEYDFQLNEHCMMYVIIKDKSGNELLNSKYRLLKGYGYDQLVISEDMKVLDKAYSYELNIKSLKSDNVNLKFAEKL